MAVGNGHVEPGFPFISYTGTTSPESCVFAQLLNIGAVLGGFVIYIRYRHGLRHFENNAHCRCLKRLNNAAVVFGMLSVFGVSIVGNFQVTNISIIHYFGAFLTFFVGFVYMLLQTIISFRSSALRILGNTTGIRKFRAGLCVIDVILVILVIVLAFAARSKGPGPGKSKRFWSPDDPGYAEQVTAAVSEWLAAFVIVIFLATFYMEFKYFRLKPPEIYYQSTTDPTTSN